MPDADASDKRPPRQACDSCRFRKVKCDRSVPCQNCRDASLDCQYRHAVRRRGPKRGTGRRLTQLKQGLSDFDKNHFQVVFQDVGADLGTGCGYGAERVPFESTQTCLPVSRTQVHAAECTTDLCSLGFLGTPSLTQNGLSCTTSDPAKQFSLYLVAHIQVFLRYMFSIMPVIDGDVLLRDAICIDEVAPSRYALILSLCAATRIHLQLDIPENSVEGGPGADIPASPDFTGEALLGMAEAALRQVDIIEVNDLDAVLSSFFIFIGLGGLRRIRRASFYLNQAISLAQGLELTTETGYAGLSEKDRQFRRRTFWLLFATERTFSLQHRRPIMLRTCIAKPEITSSDCPAVMHDFVHHVSLFELLPCSVYEWEAPDDDFTSTDDSRNQSVTTRLGGFRGERLITEGQRFETLITQQWLRMYMWRLDFASRSSAVGRRGAVGLPVDVGKVVMRALGEVDQKYKDCHGIGLEQKLFDIGSGLVESSSIPNLSPSGFGSRDLLFAVVSSLSKIRGAQSYLFPSLLEQSRHLLEYVDPAARINTSWPSVPHPDVTVGQSSVERATTQGNELADANPWTPGFDLDGFDLTSPWMDAPIEELTG